MSSKSHKEKRMRMSLRAKNKHPQDLRVQRTHRLLKEAFITLLKEKDYDDITVQEICEEAMVRRTTFYQHFEDKDSFLHWFVQQRQQDFASQISPDTPTSDLREYYISVIRSALKYLLENPEMKKLLLGSGQQSQYLLDCYLRVCTNDVVQRMEGVPGLKEKIAPFPLTLLAEYYIGSVVAVARWWFKNDTPFTGDQMAEFIRQVINGLSNS